MMTRMIANYTLTPIDEPIPRTSLRAVWLVQGVGAPAVFSSDEMLEEWLERHAQPVYNPTPIEQLTFLDKAA